MNTVYALNVDMTEQLLGLTALY